MCHNCFGLPSSLVDLIVTIANHAFHQCLESRILSFVGLPRTFLADEGMHYSTSLGAHLQLQLILLIAASYFISYLLKTIMRMLSKWAFDEVVLANVMTCSSWQHASSNFWSFGHQRCNTTNSSSVRSICILTGNVSVVSPHRFAKETLLMP